MVYEDEVRVVSSTSSALTAFKGVLCYLQRLDLVVYKHKVRVVSRTNTSFTGFAVVLCLIQILDLVVCEDDVRVVNKRKKGINQGRLKQATPEDLAADQQAPLGA